MVRQCFRSIGLIDAENVLTCTIIIWQVIDALTDSTIVPISYSEVVPGLEYDEFANSDYPLELDGFEEFLLTLIHVNFSNNGTLGS